MRNKAVTVLIIIGLLGLTQCVREVGEDGRACPCGEGWTCCELENVCIPEGEHCNGPTAINPTSIIEVSTPELEALLADNAASDGEIRVLATPGGIALTLAYQEGNSDTIGYVKVDYEGNVFAFDERFIENVTNGSGAPLATSWEPRVYVAWVSADATPVATLDRIGGIDGTTRIIELQKVISTEDASAVGLDMDFCGVGLMLGGVLNPASDSRPRPFVMGLLGSGIEYPSAGPDDELTLGEPGQKLAMKLLPDADHTAANCMALVVDKSRPAQPIDDEKGPIVGYRVLFRGEQDPYLGPGRYELGIAHSHRETLRGMWFEWEEDLTWMEPGGTTAYTSDGYSLIYSSVTSDGTAPLIHQWFDCANADPELGCLPNQYSMYATVVESYPFSRPDTTGTDHRPLALNVNSNRTGILYALTRQTDAGTELIIGSEPINTPYYLPYPWLEDIVQPQDLFRHHWNLSVPVSDRFWLVRKPADWDDLYSGYHAVWIADNRIYLLPLGNPE